MDIFLLRSPLTLDLISVVALRLDAERQTAGAEPFPSAAEQSPFPRDRWSRCPSGRGPAEQLIGSSHMTPRGSAAGCRGEAHRAGTQEALKFAPPSPASLGRHPPPQTGGPSPVWSKCKQSSGFSTDWQWAGCVEAIKQLTEFNLHHHHTTCLRRGPAAARDWASSPGRQSFPPRQPPGQCVCERDESHVVISEAVAVTTNR